MTLGEIFSHTYPKIHIVANRITGQRSKAHDLISSTFIEISDKPYPNQPDEFIKWFSKCMRNLYGWSKSQYNKDNSFIGSELRDLPNEEAKTDIYPQVVKFKKALPLHEQIIFDLYYINGLSCNEIAKQLSRDFDYELHYKSIEGMVNSIKTKIKTKQW